MSRVVVAGGAGFLGTHVCRALLDRSDEVVAVDNFSTGRECNLAEQLDRPGFEFVYGDVVDGGALDGDRPALRV